MKKFLAVILVGGILGGASFALADEVFATKNGKRYHKADCLLTKDKNAKLIAMEEVQKKALKPCNRCFGVAKTETPAVVQEIKQAS